MYDLDELINTYMAYATALHKIAEIQQWHSAVLAEASEKEQAINGIKETLAKFDQEPEVITYGNES